MPAVPSPDFTILSIPVPLEVRQRIRAAAARSDQSMSAWMRDTVLAEVEKTEREAVAKVNLTK